MVARRYANAIFALGREEGDQALSAHGACLASLGEMLAAAPDLGQTLKSPVIGVEEKKAVLGKLLDKLKADQTMRNFCFLLADKERLAFLDEIAAWCGKMLDGMVLKLGDRVLDASLRAQLGILRETFKRGE